VSPALFFGLVLLGAGLFGWMIAGVLGRRSAFIRSWFSAGVDIEWWTQRGKAQVRVIASVWILLGVGISVYGLVAAH
jgi:hypothetical protein